MRTLLISTLLATSGIAAAQPAPLPPPPAPLAAPSNCSVTIVRAPDGVRQTVEQWLAREHCTVALQVRIVPTEGGLYLLATDEHGRVRERIVPDASSAGVLIASWAADDGLGGTSPAFPPPSAPAPSAPAPMAPPPMAPPPSYSQPAYTGPAPMAGAPSAYGPNAEFRPPSAYEPIDGQLHVAPPAYPNTYLTLSAGLGSNASGTLRGELDYYGKSGWGIGLLFGLTGSSMDVYDYSGYGSNYTANVTDYAFAVALGRQWRSGDWHLRGTMALGVVESTMDLNNYNYNTNTYGAGSGSVASPIVEASLRAGRSFGATNQWALEGGLVFSYTKQEWYMQDTMSTLYREAGNVEFVVGVRHGL